MDILVACEFSGHVREAFRSLGHNAWSCDIETCDDGSIYHIQTDVLDVLDQDWDLMVAFPPCTYLARSGLHWNSRIPGRAEKTELALVFVETLLGADIPKIALENPIGRISSAIRKPDQIVQPWWFGEDLAKSTCLWLKNLDPLVATNIVVKDRYRNQTPTGQDNMANSGQRAKRRSITPKGMAEAMAVQWGNVVK